MESLWTIPGTMLCVLRLMESGEAIIPSLALFIYEHVFILGRLHNRLQTWLFSPSIVITLIGTVF